VTPLAAALVLCAGCGGDGGSTALPQGSEQVELDPANFTTKIDNPYWPMTPGTRWTYRELDEEGKALDVRVTVSNVTKRIANGVTARVVRDTVTSDGEAIEDTFDWYAQDAKGNVWYVGEDTTEYENGKPVSTEGSFEAGVKGAQAGVIVPAHPRPGLSYRQEDYKGHAEDRGEVVSLREQVEVPFGHFPRGTVLMTREQNPLEPKVLEYKFYARGVGPVLAIGVSGTADREELVRYVRGG